MGIDYSGGMIIGAKADEISEPDEYEGDFVDWLDENDMETMSLHYDADESFQYAGFCVEDVKVSEIEGQWLSNVKELGEKFLKLTGVEPYLIGTQNIW